MARLAAQPAQASEYRDAMGGHPDHTHASMVLDGRYKSVCYHGHAIAERFDHAQDPQEYHNLWLAPGNDALKLQQMRAHMDAMMATVDVGPPRFANYWRQHVVGCRPGGWVIIGQVVRPIDAGTRDVRTRPAGWWW